jgi:hypothetical protein
VALVVPKAGEATAMAVAASTCFCVSVPVPMDSAPVANEVGLGRLIAAAAMPKVGEPTTSEVAVMAFVTLVAPKAGEATAMAVAVKPWFCVSVPVPKVGEAIYQSPSFQRR